MRLCQSIAQRARQVLALALALAWGLLPVSPAAAQTTPASPPSPQQVDPDPNALKLRFGIEYRVRASNIDNFDFDGSLDDHDNFGWHRIKPFFGLRKRWFELVLQGQDARSYDVPDAVTPTARRPTRWPPVGSTS